MLSVGSIFLSIFVFVGSGDIGPFNLEDLIFGPSFLVACSSALSQVGLIVVQEVSKSGLKLLIKLFLFLFDD